MEDIEKIVSESEGKQLEVSVESQKNLRTTCKWMKFLLVLGCIGIVVSALSEFLEQKNIVMPIVYCIVALISLYPISKFWKFVSTTKTALQNADNQEMENAVSYLAQATKAVVYVAIISIVLAICGALAAAMIH